MKHFDDDDFDSDDAISHNEREEISARFEKERRETESHPLYAQAIEAEGTLDALMNNSDEEQDPITRSQTQLLKDSMLQVKAKLYSALQSKNYFISMQNAAIIREHAEYLRLSSQMLKRLPGFDPTYVAVFRTEMETFRELFKTWAADIKTIDKDGLEDEWGLL